MNNSKTSAQSEIPKVRGMGAWLAIVRTYQQCSETLSDGIKPLGLKLAQHDVMMNLLMSTTLTQQELAERSFVTKSHMSAVLVEMAELGWVNRLGHAQDKRSKVITLTSEGLALAQSAWKVQAAVVKVMMSPMSQQQISEIQDFSLQAYKALAVHRAEQAEASAGINT